MDWKHVEGTQTEKPLTLDAASSRTVVYIRRNIRRTTKIQKKRASRIGVSHERIHQQGRA